MQHFLNEKGDIPKEMPKQARELASFMALVVDETTKNSPSILTQTDIRCFRKKCDGMIKTELRRANEEIHWYCLKCDNEGVISEWRKTKWDNSSGKKL